VYNFLLKPHVMLCPLHNTDCMLSSLWIICMVVRVCPVHSKVFVVGGWPSPRTGCVACSLYQAAV
jgi:hypothetical protein